MIPNNITKDHVLKAIRDIDHNGIKYPLAKSRKYDLLFNSKPYPPKYTIALANQFANGSHLNHDEFNTTQAQDYLKKLSSNFVIQKKENNPVSDLIERYKAHVKVNGLVDEVYKWELLKQFQGRPDISKTDFTQEIKSIDFSNLIYPMGITATQNLARERQEPYRDCFKVLFDEEKPLNERVMYFNKETLTIFRQLEEKLSHHQDERTIATFLTYHNPDKYTFYKASYYHEYCRLLGIQTKNKNEKYAHYLELIDDLANEYITEDQELLDLINPLIDLPEYYPDKNHRILAQDILYQMFDKRVGMERSYWRIGTTDGPTSYWKEMLTNNIIGIGWSELGDLNEAKITTKKNIENLFKSFDTFKGNNSLLSRKSGEVFDFYTNIKKGDVILAQKGASILGIGIVIDEYNFDGNFNFPHTKQIKWEIFEPKLTNKTGSNTTVYQLKDFSFIQQIEDLLAAKKQPSNDNQNTNDMESSLNQILYGPPGTGKTYNTINKALAILGLGEEIKGKTRKEIKALYDVKVKEGQIVFTTFHQSMCYEDFIEGIKPLKPNQEDNYLKYDILPGIFKKLCQDAKTPNLVGFDSAFEKLKDELANSDLLSLKTPTGREFSISLNSNDNLTLHTGTNKEKQGTLTKENIQKQINGEEKFKGWEGYFKGVIDYLKQKYQYSEKESISEKKYVLIIDEINRGNISQIFGELITLIEDDKRMGKDEALEITLPYSKEKFSVPSNVYIIGTMNTADRSVEALDTALRRRFSFEEMMPKPELIATDGKLKDSKGVLDTIDLPLLLSTINRRVEKLLDRDHQIGHSYFMSVENLEELKIVFQNKIIPLLQEYFFGDYGKIGLVIGEGFVSQEDSSEENIFATFDNYDGAEFAERRSYTLANARDMSDEIFKFAINLLMKK